jgi:hypothetical protein
VSNGFPMNRRTFIHRTLGVVTGSAFGGCTPQPKFAEPLAYEIGITTGSFSRHLTVERRQGRLRMLDWPKLMREELELRVIDLMTATVPEVTPAYFDKLRAAADRAGCVITNLKMNQPGLDLGHPDEPMRRHALDEYKRTMNAAAHLGVRWVRPLPGVKRDDHTRLVESYRELIEHGADLGITILIENVGWISDAPDAIPAIIAKTGPALRAQPDTGNWNDAVRYSGLAQAFPFAASCDFKARELLPDGAHAAYDLERCFRIGWDAGFRGPWCLEHFHLDLDQLLREFALLRDGLRGWIRAAERA